MLVFFFFISNTIKFTVFGVMDRRKVFLDILMLKGNRFSVMEAFEPQIDRFDSFMLGGTHSLRCLNVDVFFW